MKKKLLIKVCGMKDPCNIQKLASALPDMMGFIFYPSSPRFAGKLSHSDGMTASGILRVGVFVNTSVEAILQTAHRRDLDLVQLHGGESPAVCKELRDAGIEVIKTFRTATPQDIKLTGEYKKFCRYFLFDTSGPDFGGHGRKFPWEWLNGYNGDTPFFLSGGIGPEDAQLLFKLEHPMLAGIDINSRFEIIPGIKDVKLVKTFIESIRKNETFG